MSYTLGVDIGTYETKGVLVDADGGIVAQATRKHKMLVPQAGWAEHDPDQDWWGDFVHVTGALLAESRIDPKAISAIGCSAIGPCMLPVDSSGNALMNGVLYGVDTRSHQEIEQLNAAIGDDTILNRCGNSLSAQSVGPKILWLKNNRPDIFAKTDKIHTSTTFIVNKLTGRAVIDQYTAANTSPLYDAASQTWTTELTDDIVDPEMLPEILWSCDIAGEVTASAAAETGLAAGTPVLTGTVDAAAEALSVGVASPGEMMMMYGSSIFIIMPTSERIIDPRLWYAPWLFEGQHACMSSLATAGTLTHWFRDQFARDLPFEDAFPMLVEEASGSPPGANGLVMLPYFSGQRTPVNDPHARGAWLGLNLTHTRGDMFRALLEGIALATGHITKTYAAAGAPPSKLLAVGGGTKNSIWLQATSDATGMAQTIKQRTIGASYGDAFLAAMAIGDVTLDDIDNWNPVARTVEPEPASRAVFDDHLSVFERLYDQTKNLTGN